MNNYTIKKLNTNTLPLLFVLHNYNNEKAMLKENIKAINNHSIDIWGVFDKEKLIGELRVKYKSDDKRFAQNGKRAYFYAFRILESYQGNGIGKSLLCEVLTNLSAQGYTEFTVGVENENDCANHIYRSFGFTKNLQL